LRGTGSDVDSRRDSPDTATLIETAPMKSVRTWVDARGLRAGHHHRRHSRPGPQPHDESRLLTGGACGASQRLSVAYRVACRSSTAARGHIDLDRRD
jgi:hypothetical protein